VKIPCSIRIKGFFSYCDECHGDLVNAAHAIDGDVFEQVLHVFNNILGLSCAWYL